jgi:hypothetical protein
MFTPLLDQELLKLQVDHQLESLENISLLVVEVLVVMDHLLVEAAAVAF